MSRIFMSLVGLIAILALVSCSAAGAGGVGSTAGVGSDNTLIPTTPPLTSQNDISPDRSNDRSNVSRESPLEPNHYLWGYYLFYVDPQADKIEVVPVRELETHWNVLKWLEKGSCSDCVTVVAITPGPSGTKNIDVRIKHPFGTKNFTGFDVRGIAMFTGSHTFPYFDLTTPDGTQGDGELVNADGFTTLYGSWTEGSGPAGLQGYLKGKFASATLPDANLNGYKRHISEGAANTRNAFYAGDSIIATYQLDMPTGGFIFGYAVDASWVPATIKPVIDPMTDFPPEANCYEPWKIEVDDVPQNIGLNTQGGQDMLTIRVYDWQGKDSHLAPEIECPELFNGAKTAKWQADGVGYSEWYRSAPNVNLAPVGDYKCLVKVADKENVGSPDYLDICAYQVITLTVVPWINMTPVALPGADSLLVEQNKPLHFFDDGSYDPDGGSITNWEWDWNNDGIYDETGNDLNHTFVASGYFPVVLQVTDDDGSTATAELIIHSDAPPVPLAVPEFTEALKGAPINISGSTSSDPDGSIVKYEWDTDYDWVTFTPDEEGIEVNPSWDTTGWHYVNLRLTDDFGITATLNQVVYISVIESGSTATWGGSGDDKAVDLDHDSDGNIYVAGNFSGTTDFDPGPEEVAYTATGSNDMFVCKYDPSGVFQWVSVWGGNGAESVKGISVNNPYLESPEVYVTGYYQGTVDFDPGPVPFNLTSNSGSLDAYVSKFDEDGVFQYALGWGGTGTDEGMDVGASAFYGSKEFLVAGIFQGTIDLDPGSGTQIVNSNGGWDISLSRFHSDSSVMWLEAIGGTGDDIVRSIISKSQSIPFIVGSFSDTVDFDPGISTYNRTSAGGKDAFWAEFFDSDGSFYSVRTWGGPGDDEALDFTRANNGFRITGYSSAGADFDPGPDSDIPPNNGGLDAFLAIYDYTGEYVTAYTLGGTGYDYGFGICHLDSATKHETFVAGSFEETVNFDPTGGVNEFTSNGSSDIFISAFDGTTYIKTVTLGGTGLDYATRINAIYPSFNLSTIGLFSDTVDFDPSGNVDDHISNGLDDSFLMILTPDLFYN